MRLKPGLLLALAAGLAAPALAVDTSDSGTASVTVAAVFSIAVSNNISLGAVPADKIAYSDEKTNTATVKNNLDASWYAKVKVNSAVTGATLQFKGGDQATFTALTTTNQLFRSQTSTPVNLPAGSDFTMTYRAKTDGTLEGGAAVSWTVVYTLTQTL